MGDPLTWGFVLLGVAVVVLALEVVLPTAGVLALVSATLAIAGVVAFFLHDPMWGFGSALGVAFLGPMAGAFLLKIWPHTAVGRALMGVKSDQEQEADRLAELQAEQSRAALLGVEGETLTDLRPVGVVRLNGARHDALAETTLIRAGKRVRVVHVDGSQIKVRELP